MNPTIKIIGLILYISIVQVSFGQKKETIYYDKEWKGCTKAVASFYRIVSYDKDGKPVGVVKDYFKTGEIQGEGEAIYIDKFKDSNSKWKNKVTTYYKSGSKRAETNLNELGDYIGKQIIWYENGNKEREFEVKNGKFSGSLINYYESGKIKSRSEYKAGILIDNLTIECDEFEYCQKIFNEDFKSKYNINNWPLVNSKIGKSEIIPEKGMSMKTTSERGFAEWIHIPIDVKRNFSIETKIDLISGDKNSGNGLIWGYKDWDNYYYFYISGNGYYTIGGKVEGLNLESKKWTECKYIIQDNAVNIIKLNKVKDKIYFSINGQIIDTEDFYLFRGNNIGFLISGGVKEVIFEKLIVKQDLIENELNLETSIQTDWKGSGTGFFIDSRGYIATNYHVIQNASEIEIDLIQKGKKKSYKANVISSDKENDLAIIKISDSDFNVYSKLPYNLKLQISDIGSNVFALGYPMALSGMGDEVKFTDGKISSKTGYQNNISTYQISVPVQPGNSGGPLFDYDGNIIGVISAKIMGADNVSYSIKSTYLQNLIDVLPEKINLNSDQILSTFSLSEKIKLFSDYVVLIKIK